MHGRHGLLAAVVVLALLPGCAGTTPRATEEPAATSTPAPSSATPTAGTDVTWTVPDVADYEPVPTSSDVRQLSSVADSCLFQLAQDEVPAGVTDVADLVRPVLADLGAESSSTSPATLASATGPLPATEVSFTGSLDGQPAEGVLLAAAPPEHRLLLSVTYVCTDGPVPSETWQALQAGTEVLIRPVGDQGT